MITYRMYKAQGPLAQFVRFFWSLDVKLTPATPFVHRALPDNCLELIFYCNGKLSISSCDGDEGSTFTSGIFGQAQKFRQFRTENDFTLFGVYLYPYSIRMLFNLPAYDLCNQKVASETLWGAEGKMLEEQIQSAHTHELRVDLVSDFLLRKIPTMRNHEIKLAHLIRCLVESNSLYPIASLANDYNLSRRQFERRFKEFSGLTPKDFFSIVRFKKVLKEIELGNTSLAQIAIDAGYYDQSHFTNEFKTFSGYTPKVFLINQEHELDQRATRDFNG